MALDFKGAALVAFARQQGMPMKSVLTLGRLDSVLTDDWNRHLSTAYGTDCSGLDFRAEPYAEPFFKRLGAERVESLDHSPYQGCSIVHDLNEPLPPDPGREGYDLVFDGGTLEHVFNFPNAIANCMSLVKVGGHFMASAPANQWLGHGFYQFNPELFFRVLSPENGFEVVRVFLSEFSDRPGKTWRLTDPAESGVRTLLDSKNEMLVLVWAKKIANVKPFSTWPKQSDYSTRWQTDGEEPSHISSRAPQKGGLISTLRRTAGRCVPMSIQNRIAWKRHLAAASRGLQLVDRLQ